MRVLVRFAAAGVAVCAGLGSLSACTAKEQSGLVDGKVPLGSYRLVSFDSCADALTGLRTAAKSVVGPYGLLGGSAAIASRGGVTSQNGGVAPEAKAAGPGSNAADTAAAPAYSGTNTHEVGVDEPDLVKTDGHRIVTVSGNALKVIDAASRTVTASVDLSGSAGDNTGGSFRYVPDELLLSGDHALVLMRYPYGIAFGGAVSDMAPPPAELPAQGQGQKPSVRQPTTDATIMGPRLVLVSLAGQGQVLSSVTADGSLVDARQVGSTVRVVLRSSPRISFPYQENGSDVQRLSANKDIIDRTPIEQWLPRIATTAGGSTKQAPVDCGAISRPAAYSATNLLTVLSFNLGETNLGSGEPTTLVADGDTIYSNGPSLYVASSRRFAVEPMLPGGTAKPAAPTTEIYRFDTSTPRRPTFAAGGSVPGYLINQYAMSEWDGKLRVATTTPASTGQSSASGIYVLTQDGKALKQIGSVEGLGKTQQIYAVRFVGTTGYVVTFRQTDPLYTVDLSDPTKPVVRGELKIPGYSAYLHPVNANQLIGIGQSATGQGRTTGTQVSLFDVSNLADPTRIAQYTLSGAHSEAEFDPHAFLFWPATGLLVVPLQAMSTVVNNERTNGPAKIAQEVGALVLRVSGQSINEVGFLQHPSSIVDYGFAGPIRRSLVIGQTLWTVSDAGLMASDLTSLARQTWIPLAGN